MLKCTVIIFLFLITNASYPQWHWQNPLPQGNNLQGIYFVDDYIGTAVGDFGTILRTNDGGLTWYGQSSGVTNFLYSVYFTDALNGHAVGTAGKILRTTDGGDTWTNQTIGTITNHYSGIFFLNHNLGWAVGAGGTVLRTTDSGVSWSLIFYGGALDTWLQGVFFTDSLNGFVTGNANGTFRKTTNGGFTWTDITSSETGPLYKVTFINKDNGFAVGGQNGTILRTTDGGISWDRQVIGTPGLLYGVSFINADIGFASGDHGVILKTTNGGLNWINQNTNTTQGLREISAGNGVNVFSVGGNGIMIKSSDSGANWFEVSYSATYKTLFSISFSDDDNGLAVGTDGVIVRTTNGGFSWVSQVSPTNNPLRGVCFIDNNHATAVGDNGTIIRTTDGGENWFTQSSGVTISFQSVSFVDSNNGLAVGATITGVGGRILKTTNGGGTWTIHPDVSGNFFGVSFPDLNHATVVGQQGRIWRTNDGGITWSQQSSPTFRNLNAVCFTDSNNGIAVGHRSEILKTTDGGITWALQTFGNSSTLNAVSFYDANFGLAVGTADNISTTVIRTTNGGNTWTREQINMLSIPFGVHCLNKQSGLLVGGSGTGGGIIRKRGDAPIPTTPTSLFALADTFFINLTWSDNSDNEDGFVIERKIDDSLGNNSFNFLTSVGANINTYIDTGLTPNTIYLYRVYAYNHFGGSEYSNIVEVQTFVPVELISFTASIREQAVMLEWSTGSETNNQGFEVQRYEVNGLKSQWEGIAYVEGSGTTTESKSYSFADYNVTLGIYKYRLKQIDLYGTYEYSNEVQVNIDFTPKEYALYQNYPNPFNPSTTIKYALPFTSNVKLTVYNVLGEKISELINSIQEAGYYEFVWNAENIVSGLYLYNIQVKSVDGQMTFTEVKKMIIIK